MTTQQTDVMTRLAEELRAISDAYGGDCTWALTDLATGEHIGHREHDVMPTASLIKTPILVALYQAVHAGKLRLDDPITYGPEHRVLGSGVLSKLSYGVRMTIRDTAVLMMTISDNSATNMCIDLAGIDATNALMERLGLRETRLLRRLGDRSAGLDARNMSNSSAADICALMTMLARHEAVSPEASEDMLRIMRRQDSRRELTRLLPWNELNVLPDHKQNWVAEKGGSYLNGVRTSGAIFHGRRGEFAMAAFCEGGMARGGTGREAEGNVTLGQLGKAAWDALAE